MNSSGTQEQHELAVKLQHMLAIQQEQQMHTIQQRMAVIQQRIASMQRWEIPTKHERILELLGMFGIMPPDLESTQDDIKSWNNIQELKDYIQKEIIDNKIDNQLKLNDLVKIEADLIQKIRVIYGVT